MDPALAVELEGLRVTKRIEEASRCGESEVQRYYSNSVVFITGGTGFLGKQLIEKLFRSCQIHKMYVLIREKKGKSVEQRLNEMLQEPVFDAVRKLVPDFGSKMEGVCGEVSHLRLGMSDHDWNTLTEQVNVIFHVAATTRFDESLRAATLINVRGTREVLALGAACKHLKCYVHVSTAYSNATTELIGQQVHEKFYTPPILPDLLIHMAETMEQDRLQAITHNLIHKWPNTYTFTKAVAEELVRARSDGLPVALIRPAIVINTYSEPAPGWVDKTSIYGATGIILSITLGVCHVQHCNPNIKLSFIPCDYVTNTAIVAGREAGLTQNKGGEHTKIYNVGSDYRNPLYGANFIKIIKQEGVKYPSYRAVYYIFGYGISNIYLFMLASYLLHYLPAMLADLVCMLVGRKHRFLNLARKMLRMGRALSYFSAHDWLFTDKNVQALYNNQSEKDKIIFNFDVEAVDWTECIRLWFIGVRRYIIKDGLQNTLPSLKKQLYFRILHYFLSFCLLYWIFKVIWFLLLRFHNFNLLKDFLLIGSLDFVRLILSMIHF